jgi:hypothetical protein
MFSCCSWFRSHGSPNKHSMLPIECFINQWYSHRPAPSKQDGIDWHSFWVFPWRVNNGALRCWWTESVSKSTCWGSYTHQQNVYTARSVSCVLMCTVQATQIFVFGLALYSSSQCLQNGIKAGEEWLWGGQNGWKWNREREGTVITVHRRRNKSCGDEDTKERVWEWRYDGTKKVSTAICDQQFTLLSFPTCSSLYKMSDIEVLRSTRRLLQLHAMCVYCCLWFTLQDVWHRSTTEHQTSLATSCYVCVLLLVVHFTRCLT